jgi:hypothetical protein
MGSLGSNTGDIDFTVLAFLAILLLVEDQYCLLLQYPPVFFASFTKFLSPHHHQTKTLELLFWLS